MAARQLSAKSPKNLRLHPGHPLCPIWAGTSCCCWRWRLLVAVSALANLLGTYMIRPVVNSLDRRQTFRHSGRGRRRDGGHLCCRRALRLRLHPDHGARRPRRCCSTSAATCLPTCRRCRCASLTASSHGDVMSYFTNDVDTIADALNNSFAMVIQSFIQMAGTLIILFILNWRLSLIVAVCYAGDVPVYPLQRQAQQAPTTPCSRQSLGELDGYIEEMVGRPEGGQGL